MMEMIKDFQVKGLEKLINSSAIMDIYPMVDHITIKHNPELGGAYRGFSRFDINIYLNDPTFNEGNMYMREFDPHYLVEYHIKSYLPYFNIDKVSMNFNVWGPEGNMISSFKH